MTHQQMEFNRRLGDCVVRGLRYGLCFVLGLLLTGHMIVAATAKQNEEQEEQHEQQLMRAMKRQIAIEAGLMLNGPLRNQDPRNPSDIEGAVLKTDPDLEASLETAERFRKDGNYRVATQIWQALLQRSGDALYSTNNETYYSLAQQVEKIIGSLPPEGLATYRITADAEARELLATANDPNDVAALSKISHYYFHSSLGDEVAFRLGCIYLDRFDVIGAKRQFEKVLYQYPNYKIPREQLLVRLAACQILLGQATEAEKLLNEAEETVGSTRQIAMLRENLRNVDSVAQVDVGSGGWFTFLGNEQRTGCMPALPDSTTQSDLQAAWQFYVAPSDKYNATDARGNLVRGLKSAQKTVNPTEDSLIDYWRRHQWRPTGHLLFDQERVYFKSAADLIAWDRSKLDELRQQPETKFELSDVVAWRSVWRNSFDIDDGTKMAELVRNSGGAAPANGKRRGNYLPETIPEVQFFWDRVQQQFSICNGVVYSIEGMPYDQRRKNDNRRFTMQWNVSYRRSRSNYLTAYDAKTGAVLWSLPESEGTSRLGTTQSREKESPPSYLEGGGFMSAPIAYGQWIIVPVNLGGTISVYALDPQQQGKTVWSSYLCDESQSGAEPCSPIHLTLEGSDLFVATGMGVVFVLDPSTGAVRFAKRYQRFGKEDGVSRRNGWTINRLIFGGWTSDMVIPFGRQMICFASDADAIFALDRNTGELIWRSEMDPIGYRVDHVLGIHEGVLYAAGKETIIAYDLKGEGRMIWGADQLFDGKSATGLGTVTPSGVYMPIDNAIYHFSLSTPERPGKLLKKIAVDLGTGAPVGNLFSDGQSLWVHGGNRLFQLQNVSEK